MWKKLGLLFQPSGEDWMVSHAQNPLPEHLGRGRYRVHFAARDSANQARGGFFVFSLGDPRTIEEVVATPTLDLGSLGAFDDAGVMPSSLVTRRCERWMYYTGWSRTVDVPFAFHIGLAVETSEGRFERVSPAPVLGRNRFDPYIVGAPYVLVEADVFRMWYVSATKWERRPGGSKPMHYYTVKHAVSSDGIEWSSTDHLCIPYRKGEYAVARPVVSRTPDGYSMWFSYRADAGTYRVGSATSVDGVAWIRDPHPLGIPPSSKGWDSEMICYAHPLEHEGRTYALYNGNGYGATGIGLAVWQPQ